MPIITINGKRFEVAKGTRIIDFATDQEIAARLNGRLVDLATVVEEDCEVELISFSSDEGKEVYWHSTAHLLAHAVKELFPEVKLAIGPPIAEGFYYDFDFKRPFTDEDLVLIQERMYEIKNRNLPIERLVMKRPVAIELFRKLGEIYKVELLEEIEEPEVTLYKQGDFIDLCRGPHLPSTGKIGSFKLLSVAGAYWRGDESRPMLSRIYGISFPTAEELDRFLVMREEARNRDHRVLGPRLGIFRMFEEAGPGLVVWLPNGMVIRRLIEEYWIEEHKKAGYRFILSPHIGRACLWQKSGHLDYYRENMFIFPYGEEEYVIKPMNCPFHLLVYKSETRSYRDLPLRLAELGTVYRDERSGVLHGLLRVKGFTQDDAHIFCTKEQVVDEVTGVVELALRFLKCYGFERYRVDLSVRDPHHKERYLGDDQIWEMAESGLIEALNRLDLKYREAPGEAVFYGPKIDIHAYDALGRSHQLTTVQFDFNLPHRFGAVYINRAGESEEVVMIHRAIYGSIERFIGILIEHYGGDFPLWLAPVQVAILPVSRNQAQYGRRILSRLRRSNLRVFLDLRNERLNYRIRDAETRKIPYMLIIGDREQKEKKVSVRKRKEGDLGSMPIKEFLRRIRDEIKKKA
ncbi:threonine--tRNA ligase [candidate division WOR-3 bacterium]|uniref:Threonine--tRNA ligase n=1 Tax=candidate division WOR-3 bacterium TaxID=2052148 RepID=A0A660SN29_UNCW3|nr:MAG: threonine--tRNA ligase [candidate division WOR-3 bacterium]